MSKTNLAYDLSRYEYQYRAVEKQEKPVMKTNPQAAVAARISVPKVVAVILMVGTMMCAMLYGNVEESRLYNDITKANKQVDILAGENARMQTELEGRTSVKNVEDYAENVLGLEKLNQSQIEYVELPTGNAVEIPETESNIFVIIKNKYNEIVEYLMG